MQLAAASRPKVDVVPDQDRAQPKQRHTLDAFAAMDGARGHTDSNK
jgi:hypothetical protein